MMPHDAVAAFAHKTSAVILRRPCICSLISKKKTKFRNTGGPNLAIKAEKT